MTPSLKEIRFGFGDALEQPGLFVYRYAPGTVQVPALVVGVPSGTYMETDDDARTIMWPILAIVGATDDEANQAQLDDMLWGPNSVPARLEGARILDCIDIAVDSFVGHGVVELFKDKTPFYAATINTELLIGYTD